MASDAIITGFDLSDQSRAAARWAAREAVRRRVPLEVLQAWPGRDEQRGREQLAGEVAALLARHPGLEARAVQVADDPVAVLLAAAARAELLVLGSRALGTLRGFLTGSVSQQVLGATGSPVVLVRAGEDEEEEPPGVTVGLDHAHPYDAVLGFAFEAAARRGAPLTVVHAWLPPAGSEYLHFGSLDDRTEEGYQAEQQRALDAALAPWRARHQGQAVTAELVLGRAGQVLAEAAARTGLLVVGARHRRNPVGAHLGPVTHAAIHHAPSALAVVPVR
ncbi:universal stress protein [Kitasatospora sp. NPDC006697]|uniref:universal stress protein n=1 Tax=Kitasatospora sp. NPDC006697 TaxID=3364020 RepID=UPI00368ACC66